MARQDLERNLPEASAFMRDYVWQLCLEAGIRLNPQDFVLIMRMVHAYFKTERGPQTALHTLHCAPVPASPLKSYFKAGFLNDPSEKIPASNLWEFKGWLLKRGDRIYPMKHDTIEMDDREDSTVCDACGGRFPADYCAKNLEVMKSNGVQRVEMWCNHCRQSSEQPRIRETGSLRTCQECPKLICEFHPKHNALLSPRPSVVALLPAAAAVGGTNIPANVPIPPGWNR